MRYTPFESFDRMFDQMRQEMMDWRETAALDPAAPEKREHGFTMDVTEHDGEFVLTVDMPGFERDEIDLRFHDGELVLSATHEVSDDVSSRSRSIYERVTVPRALHEGEIEATYRNGVLEVHVPVDDSAATHGREIDIE